MDDGLQSLGTYRKDGPDDKLLKELGRAYKKKNETKRRKFISNLKFANEKVKSGEKQYFLEFIEYYEIDDTDIDIDNIDIELIDDFLRLPSLHSRGGKSKRGRKTKHRRKTNRCRKTNRNRKTKRHRKSNRRR